VKPAANAAEQIIAFIGAIFEPTDWVEVRVLPSARSAWFQASESPRIVAYCFTANAAFENVYFGINPRRDRGQRGNAGVMLARCIFADFDNKNLTTSMPAEQLAEVAKRVADAWLPEPAVIVFSGHGAHVYWRLVAPVADLAGWDALMDAMITTIASDPGAKGADRIMRVPGLVNWKKPIALAELVECDASNRTEWVDLACCAFHSNLPEPVATEDVEHVIARHTRHDRPGDASVIDAFNEVVPVTEILRAAGYDIAGRHFRRPGKEDRGFSGIIRPNKRGRLVSAHWSTNDPLNDLRFGGTGSAGHTCGIHDAFDVFTLIEHKGNASEAVRAAAKLLNLSPRRKDKVRAW
jgi:hypothetical protein